MRLMKTQATLEAHLPFGAGARHFLIFEAVLTLIA